MANRRSRYLVPVLLIAVVALVGCARRPAVIMAGSPSGTGMTSSVQGGSTAVVTQQETTVTQSTSRDQSSGAQSGAMSSAPAASDSSTTQYGSTSTTTAQSGGSSQSAAQESAAQPAASPSSTTVAQTTPRPEQRDFQAMAQLEPIHFDFDKSDIRPDAARILQTSANWFRSNPNFLILIEGHCDERGTNDYNLALGERRARSTMNYLVAQGVASSRMTVISYGEERPVCSEHNEACWWKNRRAAFLVKETVPSALPAAVIAPPATSSTPAAVPAGDKASEPVSSPSQPGKPTPPNIQQRQAP